MQTPDILDIVPERVVDPRGRAPWRVRLLTGCGDTILSLGLNALVVAGLIGVGWPLHPAEAPGAISVDLVDHMPGTQPGGAPSRSASAEKAAGTEPKAHGTATETASVPSPEAKAAEPDHQAASETKPASPMPALSELKPESGAATLPTEPAKVAERPSETASATAQAPPSPEPTAPQPAAPPPPEHPDDRPEGRLVEAPSAPPPAPTQTETPTTTVPPPVKSRQAEASAKPQPQAQRPILSASDGSDTVATPTPPPETTAPADAKAEPEAPKPLTAKQQREAAATATLAAMLPFGSTIEASPFQAASPGQGQGASTAYRGAVYANFNKAQDVIAEAKARHLKGQAVIAFTIDDQGGLASIGVAVSSGNPAVDQAALELIRRAAPFPPPPPGAQRAFSPAIGLGLDE